MKIESGHIQNPLLDPSRRDHAGRVGSSETEEGGTGGGGEIAWSAGLGRLRELGREAGDVRGLDRERVEALRAGLAAGAWAPSAETIAGALYREIAAGGA